MDVRGVTLQPLLHTSKYFEFNSFVGIMLRDVKRAAGALSKTGRSCGRKIVLPRRTGMRLFVDL